VGQNHVCGLDSLQEASICEHIRKAVEIFFLEQLGTTFTFVGIVLLRRICVSVDLLLKDEQNEDVMLWDNANLREESTTCRDLTKQHLLRALPKELKSFLQDHRNNSAKLSSKLQIVKECLMESIVRQKMDKAKDPPSSRKIVVFSQWSGALDRMNELIQVYCTDAFQILRIDGYTLGKERANQCEDFNEDNHTSHILLLNYKAAGEGLNLPTGQHILFIDPWFTLAVEDQAVA
jgi:SNF2 family DNA or RNA helicase